MASFRVFKVIAEKPQPADNVSTGEHAEEVADKGGRLVKHDDSESESCDNDSRDGEREHFSSRECLEHFYSPIKQEKYLAKASGWPTQSW